MEVFIINQYTKITIFSSEKLNSSNFSYFSNIENNTTLLSCLKKLILIGSYSFFEHTVWEVFHKNNKITSMVGNNILISHFLDLKIINFYNINFKNNSFYSTSISNIFSNCIWLERESSEMFNITFLGLKDTRKLLLDYTTDRGVLSKSYVTTNYSNYYKNYYSTNFSVY